MKFQITPNEISNALQLLSHPTVQAAQIGQRLGYAISKNTRLLTQEKRTLDEMEGARPSEAYLTYQRELDEKRQACMKQYAKTNGSTGEVVSENGYAVFPEGGREAFTRSWSEHLKIEESKNAELLAAEKERVAERIKFMDAPLEIELMPVHETDLPESFPLLGFNAISIFLV